LERKIWIIGAGGFAFDIASKFVRVPGDGNVFMGFIDSRIEQLGATKKLCEEAGIPAMFEVPDSFNFADSKNRFMFGVGDAVYKKQFAEKYQINPEHFHRFEQSPNINEYSRLGPGLYWGCRIASGVSVDHASFIDANSVIGHGTSIGAFCHIAVGVIVGGNVKIGDACYLHSGAIIGNNISIGEGSVVGVGAVVVRSLPPGSKVIAPKSHNIS
jgi:hypothetical protein